MKLFFLVSYFLVLNIHANAQVTFQRFYTNSITLSSTVNASDSNYVSVGVSRKTYGSDSYTEIFLTKTDSAGTSIWAKTFGGPNADATLYQGSLQRTKDNGYIIVGITASFGVGANPNNQVFDLYLIKTDLNGTLEWSRTFGGVGNENGLSVKETTDGGYIIGGSTNSFKPTNKPDIYLIKTDAMGHMQWSKTYGDLGYYEGANIVEEANDGGYFIIGQTDGFGAGLNDIYLVKVDPVGEVQWSRTFGGALEDYIFGGQKTKDGGVIILGVSSSFEGIYLIKTDSTGELEWSKIYSNYSDLGQAGGIQQKSDGGYILSASTSDYHDGISDLYLLSTDKLGAPIWSKRFKGKDHAFCFSVLQSYDKGYLIPGMMVAGLDSYAYQIKTDEEDGNIDCNQLSAPIIVTTPSTIVTAPIVSAFIPLTVEGSPNTITGAGIEDSLICTGETINPCLDIENIFISNLVTQNQDGLNEFFIITGICELPKIRIFNGWGELVYITDQYKNDWNGKDLNDGIYYYIIESSLLKKKWSGWIHLVGIK